MVEPTLTPEELLTKLKDAAAFLRDEGQDLEALAVNQALASLNATPGAPIEQTEAPDDWDLEIEVCGMFNASDTPENCKALIGKLWRAYCDMEQRALSTPPARATDPAQPEAMPGRDDG